MARSKAGVQVRHAKTRMPRRGNHRQSRWPLRKLADRSLRPSVRSPESRRCAPGEFDGGSRWPSRQLARGIPTTVTSRRCLSYGTADGWRVFIDFPQPQRPSQVARASPFGRDASATPVRQTQPVGDLSATLRYTAHLPGLRTLKLTPTGQAAPLRSSRSPTPDRPRLAQGDGRPSLPVRLAGQADRIV